MKFLLKIIREKTLYNKGPFNIQQASSLIIRYYRFILAPILCVPLNGSVSRYE